MNTWLDARFDHGTTGFALTGSHTSVACSSCHVNGNFNLTAANAACSACHMPDFQRASNPNHAQGGFSTNCQTCHSTASWATTSFNHNATGFPLTGAHVAAACASCHVNNNYGLTAANAVCSACHMPDFQSAASPNHVQASFPTTCESCHSSTTTWSGATFNHASTGFALTGAHVNATCSSCHVNNNYGLTAANAACSACHMPDFQSVTSPNHVQGGFPVTCENCHSTTNWSGASFNHASTGFALTGAHVNATCSSCHVNNNYGLTAANAACSACHMPDFQSAVSPNHVQAAFPTTCQTCHTTATWTGGTFNHATTGFALTGAHVSAPCSSCHVNNNYGLTAANTACSSCHMPDFQSVISPNHVQANFSTNCQTCHSSTTTWSGGTFNHATTGFALTGAHVSAPCSSCHVNNNYALTAANAACSSCHMPDFQSTTNPSHPAAGFPADCTLCHSTTTWATGTFNHATTGWALSGSHASASCSSCHINNNYSLTSTSCVTCHQADYNSATTPINHVQLGYPTTCDLCHNTVAWNGATFNHGTTGFALTGAHTTVACASCHVNNNYTSLPGDCYSCHRTVYQTTSDPNHVAAGFPTTCQTCHTTTRWSGATFNHTWFPMTHGNARSVCATCHTNSSDYSVFQCTVCHTASQTNNNHNGVRNYVFNSANCYQCHPQGRN